MPLSPKEYYDRIANEYDRNTVLPVMRAEDHVLFNFLYDEGLVKGAVLDAGCGTGLFMDYCYGLNWDVQNYVGYDISKNMLLEFKTKWPQYRSQKDETANRLYHMSFLDDHLPFSEKFDLVLSLNAGLNCLSRPSMKKAIENLWSCVKKGGTLLVMTYGTLKPEERETSVHKLIKVETYPYTMVEGSVLWSWTRDLANSEDHRIYPFSKPDKEGPVRKNVGNYEEDLKSYHINRIQEDTEQSLMNYNPRIGGPEKADCSYYLTVVKKL